MGVGKKKLSKMKKRDCRKSMTWIFSTLMIYTINFLCLKHKNEFVVIKNR